ncbi:PAS domain-containing protein [Jannaschia aquimarina]|uniref:Uncharacterized protein n=1 Tax=Jannaschia aquimarina TaxID=935700 RepID=A0A0D1EPA7_9RHOB|nr:PAS domain-containing protein [Jannaschia aquimarina]KIT17500.1 hypothetical protein jaqu_06880 [Jannaschia aquimarina]SNS74420.1 PAS fold-containing protein [Jannaschia aquimarina]
MAQPQVDKGFEAASEARIAPPVEALRAVGRSHASLVLVGRDGRIELMNRASLVALGFAPSDDLRGLAVVSLWTFPERLSAQSAIHRARRGETVTVSLDLSPLGSDGMAEASFSPCGDGLILIRIGVPA